MSTKLPSVEPSNGEETAALLHAFTADAVVEGEGGEHRVDPLFRQARCSGDARMSNEPLPRCH